MRRPQSLLVSALAVAALLLAAAAEAASAGRVAALSGSLAALKTDGRRVALAVESEVDAGDTLLTYEDSHASIRFNDGSVVMLKPTSQFHIQQFAFAADEPAKDSAIFSLLKGGLRTLTGLVGKRGANSYSMQTPTATIGIRGTDYALRYCGGDCADLSDSGGQPLSDGLHVEVHEGKIFVANEAGGVELGAGQFGFVRSRATAPSAAAAGYHDPNDGVRAGECRAQ